MVVGLAYGREIAIKAALHLAQKFDLRLPWVSWKSNKKAATTEIITKIKLSMFYFSASREKPFNRIRLSNLPGPGKI
jgi:hypothetical protein